MLKKTFIFLSFLPVFCFASGTQCGPFLLQSGNDGLMHINGAKPETQKLIFLGKPEDYSNIKMQWIVPANQPGRWLGMDYIKRDGKAILNVQWLRANMNAPRIYGTYDCVKVK
ncbi:hypothetical protein H4F39_07215 [Pectobacterium brasiliense]|uniref:hypothetical protein n=1 Tax=Pectobacterium brasiliense TaxID=180957 RepID=UPI00196A0DE2|nr:hypothetical protein [Pectobacterium brasiliense]MBN3093477.1 hypothetical protein [Pectobacterium brasiliense]